jgi:hypothetical protein
MMISRLFPIFLVTAACGAASRGADPVGETGEIRMADIRVSNAAGLTTALTKAKAGDRILLAAGNYGDVNIRGLKFASDITIMSASATNVAKIDTLKITDSSRIKFQSVEIGRALKSNEYEFSSYASVQNASYITFNSVFFHGSMDSDSSNDGRGLTVTNGKFVAVQNSRFEQVSRGIVFSNSTDLNVRSNSFQNLRSDGVDFANVQRVVVDSNSFRNFTAIGDDHPDAIQFWTTGTTTPSTDIVISNNQIFQGTGKGIQGIFLRDEVGTLPYQNVRIVNNLAYVHDFYNGIAVLGGRNVEISGNTVLSPTGDDKKFNIRVEKVVGGTVRNNVADVLINTNNTALTLSSNRWLTTDTSLASKISGINKLASATVSNLVVAGTGYVATAAGSTLVNGTSTTGGGVQKSTSVSLEGLAPSGLADSSTGFASASAPMVSSSAAAPLSVAASPFSAASIPSAFAATPALSSASFANVRATLGRRFGDLAAG